MITPAVANVGSLQYATNRAKRKHARVEAAVARYVGKLSLLATQRSLGPVFGGIVSADL